MTRRRMVRDRRRYNAVRRIDRRLCAQLRRLGDAPAPPLPSYRDAARALQLLAVDALEIVHVFKYRCACGRRRQTLRFTVS